MNHRILNIVLCAAALAIAPLASAADIAIEQGKDKGSISVPSFERILKENPSQIVVVDVRDDRAPEMSMGRGRRARGERIR